MTYVAEGDEYRNIDSRQLKRFMKIPDFTRSLTPGQAEGLSRRILTASWALETRIVYDAILDGYTSMDSLPVATGLTEAQVRDALADLTKRGRIKEVGVAPVEEEPISL